MWGYLSYVSGLHWSDFGGQGLRFPACPQKGQTPSSSHWWSPGWLKFWFLQMLFGVAPKPLNIPSWGTPQLSEEKERGWNSQLGFTSNQKWNNPRYIINPWSHVKFHLFSLSDFLQATFSKAAGPMTKHYLPLVHENPGVTAIGLATESMGFKPAFHPTQLGDTGWVTIPTLFSSICVGC